MVSSRHLRVSHRSREGPPPTQSTVRQVSLACCACLDAASRCTELSHFCVHVVWMMGSSSAGAGSGSPTASPLFTSDSPRGGGRNSIGAGVRMRWHCSRRRAHPCALPSYISAPPDVAAVDLVLAAQWSDIPRVLERLQAGFSADSVDKCVSAAAVGRPCTDPAGPEARTALELLGSVPSAAHGRTGAGAEKHSMPREAVRFGSPLLSSPPALLSVSHSYPPVAVGGRRVRFARRASRALAVTRAPRRRCNGRRTWGTLKSPLFSLTPALRPQSPARRAAPRVHRENPPVGELGAGTVGTPALRSALPPSEGNKQPRRCCCCCCSCSRRAPLTATNHTGRSGLPVPGRLSGTPGGGAAAAVAGRQPEG